MQIIMKPERPIMYYYNIGPMIKIKLSDQYGYTTPSRNRNVSQLYAISRNVGVTTPKSF